MVTLKPITIVGGGLAGLTLGLALRQHEIPVTVLEAGRYPRHRVCGEFISGAGQDSLRRLGLLPLLEQAGARAAKTVAFFARRISSFEKRLPRPALCLSRFALDELLARELVRCGGVVREGERRREDGWGEGLVRATGRRLQAPESGWRWLGLKAHARRVTLAADLEMHFTPGGYVGLCRLAGDAVNVCGLFRTRVPVPESPHLQPEYLGGMPGSHLQRRLAGAEFDPASFCAVAGISLRPRSAATHPEFCIGDAITMVPPVTGNGMSMALESAELAAEQVAAFSRRAISWDTARARMVQRTDEAFARRLAWAAGLQRWLFSPVARAALLMAAPRIESLWRLLFDRTR